MPSSRNGGNIKFGIDFEANQASLNKLKKSLQDLQKIKLGDFKGSAKDLDQMQQTAKKVQIALEKAFNPTLNTTNVKTFQSELQKTVGSVDQVYNKLKLAGPQGEVAFHQMATEILTTNLKLKQTNSLIDSMGKTMVNTVKWGIASSVMNTFTQSVQGAFQYVQSLEKSLTNIRIVTGDSTERMAQFAEQANRSAQALGRSTLDYSKASLTFYQQGLNDEDVQARTEATLKAQNITGAGSQMADYLTSVWNGYKVANEEAELYVDKLAAVADSSASDMSQLAIAMSKVASTASTMGVDVDQLNAQIATVVATTRQAPESVGTAFKTIYTRMNDIKAGSDEAEISLGRYSGKMAELGFNVLDATGHLRDTGQVMDEIGDRWQNLTREQQVYLAQTMGGQRQVNQLMALFDNWTTYSELLNTSLESEGTLAEKNSRYMESLGAKMEQLGAAGERVKDALVNENELKGGVQALTNLVNLMGNFIESIGGGSTALLAFGALATQVFQDTIARQINNVITNIQNKNNNELIKQRDIENTREFGESQGYEKGVINNLVDRKQAIQQYYNIMSEGEINTYNNIIKTVAAAQQESVALEKRKEVAEAFYNSFGKNSGYDPLNKDNFEDINTALGTAVQDLRVLNDQIQDLSKKEIKPDSKEFLDTLELAKEKIHELFKGSETQLTGWQPFIDKLKELQSQSNVTEQDLNKIKNAFGTVVKQASYTAGEAGLFPQISQQAEMAEAKLRAAVRESENFQKQIQQLASVRTFTQTVAGIGQLTAGFKSLVNLTKVWKNENLSAGEKVLQTITNLSMSLPMLISGYSKMTSGVKDFVLGIKMQILATEADTEAIYKKALAQKYSETGNYAEAVSAGKAAVAQEAHAISLNKVIAKLYASYGAALPYIAILGLLAGAIYLAYKEWNKEADAAKKASEVAADSKKAYDDLKTSLQDIKSALEDLHSAEDNLNGLTKGTQEWRDALQQCNDKVLELISNYPELAQYVTNQNGQLKLEAAGEQAYLDSLQAGVQNARNASYIASSNSREANAMAAAADIGHNSIYGTNTAGQGGGYASAEQVKTVVQAIDKVIGEGADLKGGLSELTDEIATQTGQSEELVKAILSNEDAVLQLRTQLQQNETADKLMYETMAQGALADNATYKGMNQLGQQVASAIGGTDLESKVQQIEADLMKTMTNGVAVWSGSSNQQVKDILKRLNDAQGTNWKLDSNAVRGTDGNRAFAFLDQAGQLHTYTKQQIASTIAAKEALENLGTSAEITSNILSTINKSNESESAKTGIQQFLAGNNINLKEGELDNLSGETLQKVFGENITQVAENAGYESVDAFKQAFEEEIKYTKGEFAAIGVSAFGPVKQQLKESLSDGDYLLDTQQNLEAIFSKIFEQSGSDAMESFENIKDVLMETKDLSQDEKEAVLQLFANADLSTPEGLNELEESLRQIGAQVILTNENWVKFKGEIQDTHFENPVDTIFDQQASINNITGNLQKGDIISEEDLETLAALDSGVRDFFRKTAEGYELIGNKGSLLKLLAGSTPDYLEAANNLDSLIGKAQKLKDIVGEDTNVSELKATELQNYSSLLMNNLGGDKETYAALGTNQEYIQTIKQELDDLMATETDERDKNWQKEYDDRIAILREFVSKAQQLPEYIHRSTEELRSAAALNASSLSELNSMLVERERDPEGKAGISGQQFGAALQTVSKREMEDLGFDPEVYENYVDLLQATNEKYAENEYLARQVANANMRISQGTQDLIDNWKDWNKVFQDYLASDRDVGVLAEKWGQLKDTLANLFDMDAESFDLLGPDFVADNLDKIEAVKDGIPGAYEDLEGLIEENLWGQLENSIQNHKEANDIDLGQGVTINYDSVLASSQGLFDQLQAISDDANIEVGAEITGLDQSYNDLVTGLNKMIDASGMASDQMAAIFSAMGYDVEFQEKPDAIHEKSEDTAYYRPPTYKMDYGQGTLLTSGEPVTYGWPVLENEGGYETITGKKETYEPGTYAIKTITKNGKGSGGKISRKTAGAPSNKGSGGKGGKGGKGGGGGKAKEPNKAKGATNKADRYRNNTVKANKLANQMTKLQKQQERLTGKDSLKNLQKQLQILKKQNETIRERIGLQRDEQKQLANNLKKSGATFDKDGTLNNYFKVHANIMKKYNDAVAKWNKMSADQQQKNKEYLNNAKTQMDNALKDLERYDKLQQEIAKSIQQQIDNAQEQIDLQVKQFDLKIKAELDLSEAKRDWNKFRRDLIDEVRDDDILGLNKYRFADISSYFNNIGTGSIQYLTDRLKELTGTPDGQGIFSASYLSETLKNMSVTDRQARLEQIQKVMDDLQGQMEDFKSLADDIKESIFDTIDAAQDAFDQQMDEYEYIGDLINHNMKVTELLFGDQAYDKMAKYYDRIEDNNNAQLDFLTKEKDLWYSRMMEEQARMAQLNPNTNAYKQAEDRFKQYQKHWMDSVNDLNSTVEDALDNIMDKYANAINNILLNFDLSLGGGRKLDDIADEWDMLNDLADTYLDKINSAYEIEKLQNAFEDAIDDNEGNIAAQQSLNNLMEQQLAYLKDKEKLTQYDVDRANTLLQIEMKRLALEQSRANKNRLRLRRDSQGNYTYQYAADTEAMNKAEQELADARNSLYNSDKAAYVDNLSAIQKSANDIKDKLEDIWNDENLSKEQKLQKSYELQKYYGQKINDLIAENASIRNNLMDSAFEELAKMYGISEDEFRAMSKEQQNAILKDIIPQASSYAADMVENIAGSGGMAAFFQNLLGPLVQSYDNRVASIAEIEEKSQTNFENIVNDTDILIGQAEQLLDNNDKLVDSQTEQLNLLQSQLNVVSQLLQKYEAYKDIISGQVKTGYDTLNDANASIIGTTRTREDAAAAAQMEQLENGMNATSSAWDVKDYTPYIPQWSGSDFAALFGSANIIPLNQQNGKVVQELEKVVPTLSNLNTNTLFGTIDNNVFNSINNILNNILETSQEYYATSLAKQDAIRQAVVANQTIHIDADFPNAKDVSNIIEAIEGLANAAAQRANTKGI